jgi:serine O-acetyltransferase
MQSASDAKAHSKIISSSGSGGFCPVADKIFVSSFLCGKPFVVETVTKLTSELVASYARVGGINHLDGKNLPSKRAITAITVDLLRLLFPGFFDEKLVHSSEIKAKTAALLDSIMGRLEDEIRKALEYSPPAGLPKKNITMAAHSLTLEFLGSLPRVREILQTDVEAAFSGDPAARSKEEIIVSYPFVEAIAVQRLAHELYLKNVALIPRIMTEWAHLRSGMDLHPGARIGSHFFVDHCTGTVVGETAIIGNHVKMYHGVTLGAKSTEHVEQLRGRKRHPTIENRVTIYPGATILGGDTVIGAGSTIGGNVFLMESVAPNSIVLYDAPDARVLIKADRKKKTPVDFQI